MLDLDGLRKALVQLDSEGRELFLRVYNEARAEGIPEEAALEKATEGIKTFLQDGIRQRLRDLIMQDFLASVLAGKDKG